MMPLHIARLLLVLTGLITATQAMSDEQSDAYWFAAHALALRSSAISGDSEISEVMSAVPGTGVVDESILPIIWSEFFKNTIVKLGRLSSPAPVALYYNPLLDTMVLAQWERRDADYQLTAIRTILGEHSVDRGTAISLTPSWMVAEASPLDTLISVTNTRLDAFGKSHPEDSNEPGQISVRFAVAASDFRAALPRLAWYASLIARWTQQPEPWLSSVANEIEQTLSAGDAEAIVTAAPETDMETSIALANLPDGFISGLTLDMVLDTGNKKRLLIISMPEDGDLYVLARCRLETSECALERFALVSLLE